MQIYQLAINSLIAASVYALIALSFSLIYSTTRFFHFAHGAVYVAGAYSAYVVVDALRRVASVAAEVGRVPSGYAGLVGMDGGVTLLGMAVAGLVAMIVATVLGGLMELGVYRPLRRRLATPVVLLIASLGMYIVLQNVISAVFGDDTKTIRTWPVREGLNILGARITPVQIIIIGTTVVLFVATILILKYTKAGTAMRALAANPELARVVGMDTDRVILYTFLVGSALCGAAGVLISLDIDMTPTMGLNALLMGVVAAIVGGIGSLPGAALGALLLALAQNFGVWKIPSQWQDAIAFAILLVFLVFRPAGMFGVRVRKVRI